MNLKKMRELARKMIQKGIEGADPENLVHKKLNVKDNKIKFSGETFDRSEYDEVVLLGIGKASVPMAIGCKELNPDDGLIITKSATHQEKKECPVKVREASHPYPKQENMEAGQELLSLVEEKNNALFVFLVSGGGSALFTKPVEGLTLDDMNELNQQLVKSGANIHQINTVRKHVSQVKGGRLGKLCSEKGDMVSLIISDVVGDDLSVIASGPTYPDESTYEDAKQVLDEFDLWGEISKNVRNRIKKGLNGEAKETPTELDVHNILLGNNMTALKEAHQVGEQNKDINSLILTSQNEGEAKEVAKPLTGIAKEIQDTGNPIEPPAALVLGGETTVKFRSKDSETGKGGPNRELVLSAAIEIQDRENIVIASVDSDGIDGVEKAGAIADTSTIENSELDPKEYLENHDSQTYFDSLYDNLEFKSRTNVNDITVILIDEKEK